MNRSVAMVLGAACALSMSGCASVVRVYDRIETDRGNSTKIQGIPFYVRTDNYTQETVYSRSYYRVTMKITEIVESSLGQPATQRQERLKTSAVMDVAANGMSSIQNLRNTLNEVMLSEEDARRAFQMLPPHNFDGWAWGEAPVSNAVTVSSKVDYNKTYYINARAPWFGSGSLNTEFGSDGTLKSSDATVEPGIAESITDIIPFKEYFEAEYVAEPGASPAETQLMNSVFPLDTPPPGDARDPDPSPATWVRVSLDIEQVGELASFTREFESDPRSDGILAPLARDFSSGTFTIRPLQARPSVGGGNANAWTVTGSLAPPKSSDD